MQKNFLGFYPIESPLKLTMLDRLALMDTSRDPPDTFEGLLARIGCDLHPKQREFMGSEARYTAYLAGFGCVAGETLIGNTPIKDLVGKGNFEVRTLHGIGTAEIAFLKGQADLYRVTTVTGRSILVTKDHQFLTPNGWQKLRHLQIGSLIAADGNWNDGLEKEITKDFQVFDQRGSHSCGELPSHLESDQGSSSRSHIFCPSISPNPDQHFPVRLSTVGSFHRDIEFFSFLIQHRETLKNWSLSHHGHHIFEQFSEYCFLGLSKLAISLLCTELVYQFLFHCELQNPPIELYYILVFYLFLLLFGYKKQKTPVAIALQRFQQNGIDFSKILKSFYIFLQENLLLSQSFLEPCRPYQVLSLNQSLQRVRDGTPLQLGLEKCSNRYCFEQAENQIFVTCGEPRKNDLILPHFWDTVTSIKFERFDNFYDMHVPLYEHYSAHGLFNHNSGKSFVLALKVLKLCYQNPGFTGALLGPTQSMIRDTIQVHLDNMLEAADIDFGYRASPLPEYTISLPRGTCTVLLRGFENWNRIRGGNWAWAAIDEADTAKKEIVKQAMRMIDARLRVGNVIQTVIASTPEGVGSFLHDFFVKQAKADPKIKSRQKVIHGSTYENEANLRPGYIDDLMISYPEDLIKAYLLGQWVNLNQDLVYPEFSVEQNGLNVELVEEDDLFIALDFNVGKCIAIAMVKDADKIYAVDEIGNVMDTPEMISRIKNRFPLHDQNNKIWVIPDASAKNRDTSNASESDLILLSQAGFTVVEYSTNPRIKDRVASVRANLRNAKGEVSLFINTEKCPLLTEALQTQSRDPKTGLPDKEHGYDHPCDALGYGVSHLNPLGKLATIKTNVRVY